MCRLIFFLICLFPSLVFAAENEVYEVTATSLFLHQEKSSDETLISQKDIENYQEIFLRDSLVYAPSIILNSPGPRGRNVDFTIRGVRSSQNLVLVDGIYVNDPASGGSVDLSNFLNADMEQIQVRPGPQNLIYGPGALGGVIQLIPKKGQGEPSLKVHGEGGSFKTKYGAVTAQGEEDPVQFSATAAGFKRGPSSFTNSLHRNRQSDHYKNGTLSSRVGLAVTDNWEMEGLMRYSNSKVQFDESKFVPEKNVFLPFKAPNYSDTQILLSSFGNKWGGERDSHILKITYSRTQRCTTLPSFHNRTLGEHPFLSYQLDFKVSDQNILTTGLNGGQERAKEAQLHKRNHGGIFLIDQWKPFQTTEIKGGVRFDKYQSSEGLVTFNIGGDQTLSPTTNLYINLGTNFKPPDLASLFQTNLPWQKANPYLKPEKSQALEAGIIQTFLDNKAALRFIGFFTGVDKIMLSKRLADGKWQRYNGEKRKIKGLEMVAIWKPGKGFEMKGSLTLTHARDFPENKIAPFVPEVKGAGEVYWQALPQLSFFVQGYGISKRKDGASKHKLSPYELIHLGGRYDLLKHVGLFWRIENLTNKHFEEVFGYGMRGRAFFCGLEAAI